MKWAVMIPKIQTLEKPLTKFEDTVRPLYFSDFVHNMIRPQCISDAGGLKWKWKSVPAGSRM